MKSNLTRFLSLATLFTSVVLSLPAEPSAPESSSGERSLFDGKSLQGWRGFKSETPGDGWKVVDGVLVLKGKGGDLVTAEEFGDFDLSFEWRVTTAANSGVIYRVGLGEAATFTTGPEYQVLDNEKADDNKKHNHLAGSLYDLALAPEAKTRPVGEWNSGRIRVRGWHVEHWLNREKVVDVDLATAEGKSLIEASKFKDWKKFASLPRGRIALQDHGHEVSFRAIRVKELK